MKLIIFLSFILVSVHAQSGLLGGYYQTSGFFKEYGRLKAEAINEKKPIVLITGFEGCIGCVDLKERMVKNSKAYNSVAKYMVISTQGSESRFFYTTLGIKNIPYAPKSFLINPNTDSAVDVNPTYIEDIVSLSKKINWNTSF